MTAVPGWLRSLGDLTLFTVGGTAITVSRVALALALVAAFYAASRLLGRLIRGRLAGRLRVEQRVLYAVLQILHWALVLLGLFLGLQVLGFDLTSLAVIAGFLGVGIGFGLQNVIANFLAGIILLFEQSLAVGDRVTVGGYDGDVERVSMRATQIRTRDNIAIIVPNSRFIDSEVINWSHGDPRIREHLAVGVAYGSDVERVRRVLLEAAKEHPAVLKEPAPEVWFGRFGESSLDFELLVWLPEPSGRRRIRSDLHYAIDRKFREAGIVIPFPQRDVHLRDAAAPPPPAR
jgi:small-conductance mechanosensitive channel